MVYYILHLFDPIEKMNKVLQEDSFASATGLTHFNCYYYAFEKLQPYASDSFVVGISF